MELLREKIDELRDLLDLPNRNVASFVMLHGLFETTTSESVCRTYEDSGDVAYVFVGPAAKLDARIRVDKKSNARVYEITMPQGATLKAGMRS